MRPARRFPFGEEPRAVAPTRPAPVHATAPLPERHTLPMEPGAPRRAALPFVPVMLPPPIVREMRPEDAPASPPRSRAYRWARVALIVLGLLLYVAALAAIVAPLPVRAR